MEIFSEEETRDFFKRHEGFINGVGKKNFFKKCCYDVYIVREGVHWVLIVKSEENMFRNEILKCGNDNEQKVQVRRHEADEFKEESIGNVEKSLSELMELAFIAFKIMGGYDVIFSNCQDFCLLFATMIGVTPPKYWFTDPGKAAIALAVLGSIMAIAAALTTAYSGLFWVTLSCSCGSLTSASKYFCRKKQKGIDEWTKHLNMKVDAFLEKLRPLLSDIPDIQKLFKCKLG